jgi:pilus assembly protein CpaE
MNRASGNQGNEGDIITIMLVDDIPEARENIKKMLAFEPDMKVVGTAGTGREAVTLAKEIRPNIIIMDINMPDMDGIQATTLITEAVPTVAVIMMSVQNDPDYLRRAMLAGAKNFLPKPVSMDELYNTIRTVHARNRALVKNINPIDPSTITTSSQTTRSGSDKDGNRAGHVVVVYSPQGGAGCTTIATNLASGVMKEGIRALLVDADLQFGDVGVFLNMQAQSTIIDLASNVDDLDTELFDNIVMTHDTGLKVLMGPARPEMAEVIQSNPAAVARIIDQVRSQYDFIVVDTSNHLDETLVSLFDIASKIVLVTTPTLVGVKNVRFVLDLFDQLEYPADKVMLVLNRVPSDKNLQKFTIAADRIEKFLRRSIDVQIPADEFTTLSALYKGVLMVAQRDRSRSPMRELLQLSELVYSKLLGNQIQGDDKAAEKSALPKLSLFGRKS